MPGFFISNTKEIPELKNYYEDNCYKCKLEYKEWIISVNTLNKYLNDKLFVQNDTKIIILDGVVLNKNEIIEKNGMASWEETVDILSDKSETWFKDLRGVFSGAIFDKKTETWTAFADQCGSHLVLEYNDGKNIAIGSQLNYFTDWMKLNNIERKIDDVWLDDMLYFGYMVDKHTIIRGITRVYPGTYLKLNKDIDDRFIYHRLTKKNQVQLNDDDAIELLDKAFSNVIKNVILKDKEYGYKTIVDISGGLDSRMNLGVALKYSNELLGITYAQTNCDDYRVSQKIKEISNIESFFYALDSGKCLLDIDELVFMNQGLNYYYGITGGKKVLESLDSRKTGIEIWGLLGDINEGVMVQNGENAMKWDYDRFRTICKYQHKDSGDREIFDDFETQWFYARGMLAGMNTGFIRQNFVEPVTPYGDVDFMELCYSLPYAMRGKHHIYRRWMKKKYPQYAKIECAATGIPLTCDKTGEILGLPRRAYRRVFRNLNKQKATWSMNPIKNWYKTKPEIREYYNAYFNENIHCLKEFASIDKICRDLFEGDINEKIISLTIISAIKQYIL